MICQLFRLAQILQNTFKIRWSFRCALSILKVSTWLFNVFWEFIFYFRRVDLLCGILNFLFFVL